MAHTPSQPTPSDPASTSPTAVAAAQAKVNSPTPELAEAITRGYEPHDIGLRGVFIFLGGLVASLVVVFAVILGIMLALVGYDRSREQAGSVLTAKQVGRGPVYAPLQPSIEHNALDADDMTEMRKATYAILHGSGVRENGRRFVPVESAIGIVVDKLHVRPAVPVEVVAVGNFPSNERERLHQQGYILTGDREFAAEKSSSEPK